MNETTKTIPEVPARPITELDGFAVGESVAQVSKRFPKFFRETYIYPLLKKKNWNAAELDIVQSFMEDTLCFALNNSIILLSALGGSKPAVPDDAPSPCFGIELDYAVHDFAHQALEYCEMFNEISLALIWELKRQIEKGGVR